jgi:hypothetical protein
MRKVWNILLLDVYSKIRERFKMKRTARMRIREPDMLNYTKKKSDAQVGRVNTSNFV